MSAKWADEFRAVLVEAIGELEKNLNRRRPSVDRQASNTIPRLLDQVERERAESKRLLESRNAYARALSVALESGVFFEKTELKARLEKILRGHRD